jgi:hypothetical protein
VPKKIIQKSNLTQIRDQQPNQQRKKKPKNRRKIVNQVIRN